MDKMYYYARKTKMAIEKSIEDLDNHELFPSRVPQPDDDASVFSDNEEDSDDDDGNVDMDADKGDSSDSKDETGHSLV